MTMTRKMYAAKCQQLTAMLEATGTPSRTKLKAQLKELSGLKKELDGLKEENERREKELRELRLEYQQLQAQNKEAA